MILRNPSYIIAKIGHERLILGTICFLAFVAYIFFPWATTRSDMIRFNSPDETANYFFSSRIADVAGVAYPEPLNKLSKNIIHPRSTNVVDGKIIPTSFLGLPVIYGSVGILFSKGVIPFLTPFISALAIIVCYSCWRRFFSRFVSIISVFILAIHPAVWYYSSRGLYHNILFLDLVIFAWWGYLQMRDSKWSLEWFSFSILMVIAALFVRSSEALWIIPIIIYAVYTDRRRWTLSHLVISLSLIGGIGSLIILLFASVYNSPIPILYSSVPVASSIYSSLGVARLFLTSILSPFGFDAREIIFNVFQYILVLFIPLWVLAFFGYVYIKQSVSTLFPIIPKNYLRLATWISVWLIFYYGSWSLSDTVGPQGLTVGISYVRYWLPIFVVWIPFVAMGLIYIWENYLSRKQEWFLVLILFFVFWGFSEVYFEKTEGLVQIASRLSTYRATSRYVNNITGEQAIIVGDRSDKVFFPDRRVISPGNVSFFSYSDVMTTLPYLADSVPVYLYLLSSPNKNILLLLKENQLILKNPAPLPDGAWLYPVLRL